jgi:threonine/homoserine/homoserine lactone efflux protein
MLRTLAAFVPVALIVTITPGPATAMVVRSAAVGGRRHALACTAGNSIGVLAWGVLAAAGLAAVVATSAAVFTAVKLAGAAVLVVLGLRSLLRPGDTAAAGDAVSGGRASADARALRDGLVTSLSNPKLAVFYIALFPQFVPAGAPVLPSALLMAATIVAFDCVWYSALAYAVARARRAFVAGRWARRVERLTGAVLVALGVRLALERR